MPNVHVTIATWDYDHVRDLRMGEIRPIGIDALPVFKRREFRYGIVYVNRDEQGIARRLMAPEEIFPPGIMVKAAV